MLNLLGPPLLPRPNTRDTSPSLNMLYWLDSHEIMEAADCVMQLLLWNKVLTTKGSKIILNDQQRSQSHSPLVFPCSLNFLLAINTPLQVHLQPCRQSFLWQMTTPLMFEMLFVHQRGPRFLAILSLPAAVSPGRLDNYPCSSTERLINLFHAADAVDPRTAEVCSLSSAKQELSSKLPKYSCWNLTHRVKFRNQMRNREYSMYVSEYTRPLGNVCYVYLR